MFLYPAAMEDATAHLESIKELSKTDKVAALDLWLWRGETAKEEIKILKDSGKIINYNIGDRFGEDTALPASKSKLERDRAYSLIMREIGYALELGSKKIVFGSGPDDPEDREGAIERYFEFVMRFMKEIPSDVETSFEPTDRDIHKRFLFGPMDDTVDFIKRVRGEGYSNIGLLIDMCHMPIIYETLESGLQKGRDVLNHIHLGNCVIKNQNSPLYGDRHPAWGYEDGEYTEEDGIRFIKMLRDVGYTEKKNATISFEMRPYVGKSAMESLERFVEVYNKAGIK